MKKTLLTALIAVCCTGCNSFLFVSRPTGTPTDMIKQDKVTLKEKWYGVTTYLIKGHYKTDKHGNLLTPQPVDIIGGENENVCNAVLAYYMDTKNDYSYNTRTHPWPSWGYCIGK